MILAKCDCGWMDNLDKVDYVLFKGKQVMICPSCHSDSIATVESSDIETILLFMRGVRDAMDKDDWSDMERIAVIAILDEIITLAESLNNKQKENPNENS